MQLAWVRLHMRMPCVIDDETLIDYTGIRVCRLPPVIDGMNDNACFPLNSDTSCCPPGRVKKNFMPFSLFLPFSFFFFAFLKTFN